MNKNNQVNDDRALLDQMMADLERADELYRPTNYWKTYEDVFLPELKKYGLHDFRRRKFSILESFGASDLSIKGKVVPRIRFKGAEKISRMLNRFLWGNFLFPMSGLVCTSPEWITGYFYKHVLKKFQSAGMELNKCSASLFGNPEDIIEVNGLYWSLAHLNYCSMMVDTARYINFGENMVVCELGSGMGRNIEILAKLYPEATLIMFDISPQLYVANQYLVSVFGNRVIPYRDAVKLDKTSLDQIKGRIVILPTWAMPKWSALKVDIFWNSASFQEMEPNVVKNYLGIVKKMSPGYIYIDAMPKGNYWGEWKPGKGGTKEPVLSSYYTDSLKDSYLLKVFYETDYFLFTESYQSFIFEKIQL